MMQPQRVGDGRRSFSTMFDGCVPQLEEDLSEMF